MAVSIEYDICCYAHDADRKVIWQITDRCHLRCSYCFTPGGGRSDTSQIEACAIVDTLRHLYPHKKRILFAGREPLLYPAIMPVVAYSVAAGFRCSMSTSGELLDEDAVGRLAAAGLYKVNVTVNSSDAGTHRASRPGGSLKCVIDNVAKAHRAGILVRANITVTRETLPTLAATIGRLVEADVGFVSIGLLHPFGPGGGASELELQLRHAVSAAASPIDANVIIRVILPPQNQHCSRDHRCPVRRGLLAVLPDGTLTECNIFPAAFGLEQFDDTRKRLDRHDRSDRSILARMRADIGLFL